MIEPLEKYFDEREAFYTEMLTSYIPYKRNIARGNIMTLEHFKSMCIFLDPHQLPKAIDEETDPTLFLTKLLNAKDGREEKKYFHAVKSFEKVRNEISEQIPR